MTRWPTTLEKYVCTTPSTPVATDTAIMPATRMASSLSSSSGIALSRMSRSRNGDTIPRIAETTINASTEARRPRYGRNRRAMRRVIAALRGHLLRRGLEREVEDLVDAHHRVELHLLADVGGHVVEIAAVALGQDDLGEACRVRGEHLLLEA